MPTRVNPTIPEDRSLKLNEMPTTRAVRTLVWRDLPTKIAPTHKPRPNPGTRVVTTRPLKHRLQHTDKNSLKSCPRHGRNLTGNIQKAGPPQDPRQRFHDRRAFSAAEQCDEDEEDPIYNPRDQHAFSATRPDNEDHEEEDGDDSFNGTYDSDEGDA